MLTIFKFYNETLYKYFLNKYVLIVSLNVISGILQASGIASAGLLVGMFLENDQIKNLFLKITSTANLDYQYEELIFYLSIIILLVFSIGGIISFYSSYFTEKFTLTFENKVRFNSVIKFLNSSHSYKMSQDKIAFENLWSTGISRFRQGLVLYFGVITSSLLLVFYLSIIAFLDFYLLSALAILGSVIFLSYKLGRSKLYSNSIKENILNRLFSRVGHHINHAYREIIYLNLENKTFKELLDVINKKKFITLMNFKFIHFPKHLLEVMVITIFVIFANYYSSTVGLSSLIPKLTIIFLSIWKSLPLINAIYRNISSINTIFSTLKNIHSGKYYLFKNVFDEELKKKDSEKFALKEHILFKKVKFSYDKNKIFSFQSKFTKGDWTYVYGKSGSGKTTFFNLLAGQIKPISGDIFFDNENIKKNFQKKFNSLGYVHQNIIIFQGTVAENICFKKRFNKKEIEKIKEIYDICGLDQLTSFFNIFKKKINLDAPTLSGGQRQRLGLARILYNDPLVLILDESFNALDYRSELKILGKIKKKFPLITLFYASHRKKNKLFNKLLKVK